MQSWAGLESHRHAAVGETPPSRCVPARPAAHSAVGTGLGQGGRSWCVSDHRAHQLRLADQAHQLQSGHRATKAGAVALIGRHLLAQGGEAAGAFVAGACATGARQLHHQIGAGGSEATPLLGREGLPAMPVGVIRIREPSAASSIRASGLASQSAVNCSGVRRRPTQSEAGRVERLQLSGVPLLAKQALQGAWRSEHGPGPDA